MKVKVSKVGQPDVYVPAYEADGKTLTVDSVVGPGAVPLGGLVAVMPNIDVVIAWQPPATGEIKDGFMRADGTAITSTHKGLGCKLTVGTVLPNLTAKYLKGNTASGATGGSNTFTPAGTNAASNVPALGLTFSGTSGTYSVSVPSHYHNTFSLTAGGQSFSGSASVVSNRANQPLVDTGNTASPPLNCTNIGGGSTSNYAPGYNWTVALNHTHLASSVTGTIGNQAGSSGDSPLTASGSNTPAGTIIGTATAAAQVFTGTQGNNEPAYVEVVWVIRVK